jgi:hypothetical protein
MDEDESDDPAVDRWMERYSNVCHQRDELAQRLKNVEKVLDLYGPLLPRWVETKLRRALLLSCNCEDKG